ncbi:Amidase domain-containing protein [Mycena indigotica]|uniref:Amidase domain-containing protein n=1 Tax=Mycena indigotica TaxID=2126181 RepID=A0A8H6SEF3_9AGAR|nr:Amidase domain-containing protein [Mycena indigotica]KAF7297221.1 Amidase domain-containing protein [Mycena indigotica]
MDASPAPPSLKMSGKIPGPLPQIQPMGKTMAAYRFGLSSMARWAVTSITLALVGTWICSDTQAHGFSLTTNPFRVGLAFGGHAPDTVAPDTAKKPSFPDLYEASVPELQAGLDSGLFTSVDLVKAYFARIEEVNLQGPELRAVLELNPSALQQAAALDKERKIFGKRSELHGIPILLKDNIATVASEGMNTTAGSFSLLKSIVPEDAGVVKRLRKAGAVILGKANLSEWAHFRGNIASGWSGRGGQATNAYFPKADPCGSSSGSGIAASIGLAAVTLGTETDGSITCPSSNNNLAGIKPTLGLTSRAGVIPISAHQDTVGPMTRSLTDAAIVLSVIAGKDPNDNFTLAQPPIVPDFTKALNKNALKGKRIGVPRRVFLNDSITGNDPSIGVAFEEALLTIKKLGATVVDPADLPSAEEFVTSNNETIVLNVDFKIQLNAWFKSLLKNPSGVESLADLIKFDDANPTLEEPKGFKDQSQLIAAEATTGFNATFFDALAADHDLGSTRGIDFVLKKFKLDALVLPAPGFTTVIAAVVGYPIVTVPLGFFPENVTIGSAGPETVYPAPGVPFGLSFLGTAFSEMDLIGFGFAYEQETQTRLKRKAFAAAIPKTQLADIVGK